VAAEVLFGHGFRLLADLALAGVGSAPNGCSPWKLNLQPTAFALEGIMWDGEGPDAQTSDANFDEVITSLTRNGECERRTGTESPTSAQLCRFA
jgi:hypothetical protein